MSFYKDKIFECVKDSIKTKIQESSLGIPEREEHGDYSLNIAFELFSELKGQEKDLSELNFDFAKLESPVDLAEKIVERLKANEKLKDFVSKIEVAGGGFINFWLKKEVLINEIKKILSGQEDYGRSNIFQGKKYLLEHTSPNTIKTLHIGHVRNNVLGMAVHNLLEFCGADVKLDAINNDRGIHVMKAVWAYERYGQGKTPEGEREKPDHFVDKFYVIGAKESEDPLKKQEMQELLQRWEKGDSYVRGIWKKLRDWTLKGFAETYKRLGSYHDHQWYESDFYEKGKEMVEKGLKIGVFRKLDDGAVLSDLKKYNLPDTIVLRSDGTSMYHTQDLYLTKLKRDKFPSDLYIWDIGPEQELYLKQLFAMCEQLGIGKCFDYYHLSYGFVYLKGVGKMSSRKGNVVSADDLMDRVVMRAKEIIEKSDAGRGLSNDEKKIISEIVGLGAIKYGFLKMGRTTDFQFDIDESLSLEGNSGPYIQYTYARMQSVIRKAQNSGELEISFPDLMSDAYFLISEEYAILRYLARFSDIIEMSAKNYSPNILCKYLYDLAQKYNYFYQTQDILEERTKNREKSEFRIALTKATAQIIKNGLNLLGIQAPERM